MGQIWHPGALSLCLVPENSRKRHPDAIQTGQFCSERRKHQRIQLDWGPDCCCQQAGTPLSPLWPTELNTRLQPFGRRLTAAATSHCLLLTEAAWWPKWEREPTKPRNKAAADRWPRSEHVCFSYRGISSARSAERYHSHAVPGNETVSFELKATRCAVRWRH